MIKWKRKIVLSFASLAAVATTLGTVVSCANNPNSGIEPENNYAYTIYFSDGTHEDVDYDTFLKMIADHQGTPTDVQIGLDNQLIKYLYQKEQAASIIANNRDSSIAKLENYNDVYTDARNQLNNAKSSCQKQYGVNWQEQWSKALLSTQYGGAYTEDQAVEYLAVQKMKSDAVRRYTLKIDTTTYKAQNIDDNKDYPFLKGFTITTSGTPPVIAITGLGNAIPDKNTKNAIAMITDSFDNAQKSPDHLINNYMSEYKSATVIRHILYAIKAGAKASDSWTVTKDTLKKLFTAQGTTDQVWDRVMALGTDAKNWVGDTAPINTLVQNYSDDGSEAKSNGSLAISSGFDSINSLVPGFAIPIGLQLAHAIDPSVNLPVATSISNIDFNAIVGTAIGSTDPSYRVKSSADIDNITDQQLIAISNGIRKVIAPPPSGGNTYTRPLYMTIGTKNMPAVFSTDGLHLIYTQTTTAPTTPTDKYEFYDGWIYSDLNKTKDNRSLEYNVTQALNKKFTPDANLTSVVEDFKNDSGFLQFAESQKNYADPKVANFASGDINNAVNITEMLHRMDKQSSYQALQKKYQDWWDTNINKEPLVNPGAITLLDIKKMISVLGEAN